LCPVWVIVSPWQGGGQEGGRNRLREFPPRQKPGSFNLDRVMEAVTSGNAGNQ